MILEIIREILSSIDSSSFVSALLGAAFGALIAHHLAAEKEKKNETQRRYSTAIRAQVYLIEQFNFIKNFRQQNIDPFRGDDQPSEQMRRVNTPLNRRVVDIADIAFLLEKEDSSLLLDISVIERNYLSTLDALEEFNLFKKNIERKALDYDTSTRTATIILSEQERDEWLELTKNLFEFTDKSEKGLKESIEKLRLAIKGNFPKMKTYTAK